MDFPIQIDTFSRRLPWATGRIFKLPSLEVVFIVPNSVDPDEMQHYAAFFWVFTVCQSTPVGVSISQRVLERMCFVLFSDLVHPRNYSSNAYHICHVQTWCEIFTSS